MVCLQLKLDIALLWLTSYCKTVFFVFGFFAEPGYYEDGNFGIRLENVLVVNNAETEFNFGDKGYLQFEHITWVFALCLLTVHVLLSIRMSE